THAPARPNATHDQAPKSSTPSSAHSRKRRPAASRIRFMPQTRRSVEDEPVIFIAGATGSGTTTLASAITPIIRAFGVIGTDTIRESLRSLSDARAAHSEGELRILRASTYDAWVNNEP